MKYTYSLATLLLVVFFSAIPVVHASSDIVSQTPVNGALGVAATSVVVTVVFDRNITAVSTNISFSPSVAFTFATSSNILTITPSASLSNNTTYTLTLGGIQDTSGNVLSSYASQFTTANNYSIPLYHNTNGGLNLISLPVQPSNTAIASVLGTAASLISSVWTYDPTSGWLVYYPGDSDHSNLTTMNTGYGYWITTNADTTLSGTGSLFTSTTTPPSRTVQSGWNLLGYYQLPGQSSTNATSAFSSISSFTTLVGYDNQTGAFKNVSSIVPGDAFWLGIPSSGTYYPSYSSSSSSSGGIFGSPTSISVTKDSVSPASTVAGGATNVKWASFDMLATGENVKVTDLYIYASSTQSTGALAGVGGLKNGKVYMNGVQIGSTKNIGSLVANKTDFALGSSLILPAGQTVTVDVYADAKDTAGTNLPNNSSVVVTLASATNNAQGQTSLNSANVPASDISGNILSVAYASLAVAKYSGYGAQTVIAGANNAKIGSFTLSTGSIEGVTVNTIALTLSSANAASITNLTLKDDATGTVLGSIITTPNGSTNGNQFSVNFTIPVSSSKTIDVYGNILSGANSGSVVVTVDTGTTGTGVVTGTSASVASPGVALQTITIGSGTLTVTRGAGDPTSNVTLAGASSIMVGEFNFASQNSSYTVNNLAVLVPNGAATSVTSVTVSYKDVNGSTQTSTQALNVNASNAYATATFTGLTMYVPMNDSANLDVYVGTPTVASGATSGAAINVSLDEGNTNTSLDNTFRAVNAAGSAIATPTNSSGLTLASNGTFYVRKSIPTFAIPGGQGGSIIPTNPIYRFSISADPAGPIEWTRLTFTVATTSTSLTGVDLIDESTGNSLLDNNTNSASTTNANIVIDLTQNSAKAQYAQIAAGSTKTYDLNGTIGSFITGSSLTIKLAQDTGVTANATAATVPSNVVWSDRSASPHTPPSVGVAGSADFMNGYLLKNFVTNSISYSK